MNLSHEQWLAQNLMKHHHTKGMLAIQTKEQLSLELDKLLDKDIHNIPHKTDGCLTSRNQTWVT